MQRLPVFRERSGADALVHLLLAIACILTLGNFFTTLAKLDARKAMIAGVLFHSTPPAAIDVAEARTNVVNPSPGAPPSPSPAVPAPAPRPADGGDQPAQGKSEPAPAAI